MELIFEKSGKSRFENRETQPLVEYQVFNNPRILTEAWYPTVPSKKISRGQTVSHKIGSQRLVLFRGNDGRVRALDTFCPHMGADLAHGKVEGNGIRCYFHRWLFAGSGELAEIPCQNKKIPLRVQSYPVEEKYGYVWVYSGEEAPQPVPQPPGLASQKVSGRVLVRTKLFVHHHVLMVSAIDLQHFASVHGLHADFEYQVQDHGSGRFIWSVVGKWTGRGWRERLGRYWHGDQFEYQALFAEGSIVSLTYGGTSVRLPQIHLLWGNVPDENGVSDSWVFSIEPERKGFWAPLKRLAYAGLTFVFLAWLKDDDVKAFPRMRFQARNLIEMDKSAAHLIHLLDKLPRSKWSFEN